MLRGTVFNLQRYSIQDGPGIRTTVFLKGCPLSCAWCHNPEGIRRAPEIIVQENRCLACAECRSACPVGSSEGAAGPMTTGYPQCTVCGACVSACPTEARRQVGRDVEPADLMREILRDRVFFEESCGGVTFSGGEPLHQPEFLLSMLRLCKDHGIHTTVDTCGLAAPERLMEAARLVDLFLFDLKLMDNTLHEHFTGCSNRLILHNLQFLAREHGNIWLRVPVIPGVNDSDENLRATAEYAKEIRPRRVNLLPYHGTGAAKARRVGFARGLSEVEPPSAHFMNSARSVFERAGLMTQIGG